MIDPNRHYRTRDGRAVRIYATDTGGSRPIHGAIRSKSKPNRWDLYSWREDGYEHGDCGAFNVAREDRHDLIEVILADELQPLIPWSALRPEIRRVAMNSRGVWFGTDAEPSIIRRGIGEGIWYPMRWPLAAVAMPEVDPARWRETLVQRPDNFAEAL